jgi:hypothetical protein
MEDCRVAAIAHAHRAAMDAQAARVLGLLHRDGHIDVGEPPCRPFEREGQRPFRPRPGLVEQIAVAGVGHARHPGHARGDAGQQAADREMGVDHVGPLGADERQQCPKRPDLSARRHGAGHGQTDGSEPLGADHVQHRPVGADAHHLMPARAQSPHQREHELAQREIDVRDLQDLHGARYRLAAAGSPSRDYQGKACTFLIRKKTSMRRRVVRRRF